MQSLTAIAGPLAQLVAASALILYGLVAARGVLRLVTLLVALLLVASAPITVSTLSGDFGEVSRALPDTVAVAVLLLAVATILACGLYAARNLRSPAISQGGSGDRAGARAREARQMRLRGLLKREHEKLETVTEMHRYFELGTRNSQITMSYQDGDLRYRWIVNPRPALTPGDMLGHTDDDYLPDRVRPLVIGHKRRALTTATTQTFELELTANGERVWYRVDVVPIKEDEDGKGEVTGIVSTAIDITRSKRLDMMRIDLSRRLAETLQRFNLALRSERIMVFSQDLSLRYTWANSDETQVGSIIGRTDDEVIPEEDREAVVGLKRKVIASKRPASAEIGIGNGSARRWFDLHVEPNLKPDGSVSGITCASIDITHRKRNEEQMQLVMRELTHRTKNLLTVVIAIARQTATRADSVEAFVPALIARLRALSTAQDLIVADDWAGVNIGDLVRALVGQYVPPQSSRVRLTGPQIVLSPEAAQNLGLAIHELASNAVQYGAFANASGTLFVGWDTVETARGTEMSFTWQETGGPQVMEPTTRGFGMMVIERNLSRALGAEVTLAFRENGLHADVTLPLQGVAPLKAAS